MTSSLITSREVLDRSETAATDSSGVSMPASPPAEPHEAPVLSPGCPRERAQRRTAIRVVLFRECLR